MVDILNKQYSSVFSPILSDETYENFTSQRIDNLNVNTEMPVVYFSDILLREAIKKMRNFASPGPDGMYGACLKHGGIFVEHALGDIFNESLEIEVAPQQTRISWICPVWKGECKMTPSNYRPIALTSQISKCFESIMRMEIFKSDGKIWYDQCGTAWFHCRKEYSEPIVRLANYCLRNVGKWR